MVKYSFKDIKVVPNSTTFIDIVLSRTQRKTPTVIHARMKISRIRSFYMRKVKYTQTTYNERLTRIIDDFPKIDSIHPFFSDLINVLYDKDHYKLALGQLNTCRSIIDKIGKDYIKLLKYSDSAYRCKQLKRAALGRMVTVMKKQKAALGYLEQVRQHLSRLPQIDPDARTLVLTGFPNVGKSSFINKITRAEVEVQNYAFTTKSLYVGHMDYNYLRWQVIDSPGILDRPLEDRNTIEMQAITALAHLNACIIFILDLDPTSKYSIREQIHLFRSLKPLWIKKPVVFVCNKTDLRDLSTLLKDEKNELAKLEMEGMVKVIPMSNLTEQGIMQVRNSACDRLLAHRVNIKTQANKIRDVANRIHVAQPNSHINKFRPPFIPPNLLKSSSTMEIEKKSEKELERENGGFGIYNCDMRKFWNLKNKDWKYDAIPEIWNGKNISNFVDIDILKRLAELEREEDEILTSIFEKETNKDTFFNEESLSEGDELLYNEISYQKEKRELEHKSVVKRNVPKRPREIRERNLSIMEEHLQDLGYDLFTFSERAQKTKSETIEKKKRDRISIVNAVDREKTGSFFNTKSYERSRTISVIPLKGMNSIRETLISRNLLHRSLRKLQRQGQKKTDRSIPCKLPKHLNTGKRGLGKTDWR